jgi:hypothetical protein
VSRCNPDTSSQSVADLSDGIRAGIWALSQCHKVAAEGTLPVVGVGTGELSISTADLNASVDAVVVNANTRSADVVTSTAAVKPLATDRPASARNVFEAIMPIARTVADARLNSASIAVGKETSTAVQVSAAVCSAFASKPPSSSLNPMAGSYVPRHTDTVVKLPPVVRPSTVERSAPKRNVSKTCPHPYARSRITIGQAHPQMMPMPPVRVYLQDRLLAPPAYFTLPYQPFRFAPPPYHWFPPPPRGYWRP